MARESLYKSSSSSEYASLNLLLEIAASSSNYRQGLHGTVEVVWLEVIGLAASGWPFSMVVVLFCDGYDFKYFSM